MPAEEGAFSVAALNGSIAAVGIGVFLDQRALAAVAACAAGATSASIGMTWAACGTVILAQLVMLEEEEEEERKGQKKKKKK